ncbi:zinc-ribbon-domain-containing protein [Globomyces pollinis-pini]|nr:zinc-ribbon-domain-containing protein [Globomyces pollinis-pini]
MSEPTSVITSLPSSSSTENIESECHGQSSSRVPRTSQPLLIQRRIIGNVDSQNTSQNSLDSSFGETSVSRAEETDNRPMSIDTHSGHIHGNESEMDHESDDDSEDSDSDEDDMMISQQSVAKPNDQAELRKQILQIQSNTSLTSSEKAKKIQEIMTRPWATKQKQDQKKDSKITNYLTGKGPDFSIVTDVDRTQTFHSGSVLGCKHYQRACKLQAHCCGKWDTCRFCHDEVSDHTITRNLIQTMMCMYCWKVQPAGRICINEECAKPVSAYYCKECKLWDNDPRKNIYHCYDCGICRIGKGLGIDYFHCPTCNVCMAIGLKGKHKCIERNLESDCPICGEYMFTSTSTVIFMPCGHCMHHKCHQQHIHTSYQCPTCLKSLADMTEYFRRIDLALTQHQMPVEYKDTYSHIYCNDCEKRSHAKFHFIYHKCGHCKGYNTKLLTTVVGLPEGSCIAPPVQISNITNIPQSQGPITRIESTTSVLSAVQSSSSSSSTSSYWCHQCQVYSKLKLNF